MHKKKKMKKKEEISGCFQKKEQISPSVPGKLGEVEEMALSRKLVFIETLVSTGYKEWVPPFKELPV